MSTLTLRRDSRFMDSLRRYRILLDGKEVVRLSNGETFRREIPSGEHVIEARIDWCGSRPRHFVARAGEDTALVVRNNLRGLRIVFALFYIVFRARDYLAIE
jgi:hypothetical protein